MLSLRIRVWAQLQRLSLDYYERELAGRIMTRMTTDVDQFESLVTNGLLSALVAFVTFVGVGVTLLVVDLELGLITLSVMIPLAVATVWFRRRAVAALRPVARAHRRRQRRLPGEPVRACASRRRSCTRPPTVGALPRARARRTCRSRVAAQRLVATYFPFVQFLAAVADALVLGVGASLIGSGSLTVGRAHRVPALHRHVLRPHPAAVAGVRLVAADPGVGATASPT